MSVSRRLFLGQEMATLLVTKALEGADQGRLGELEEIGLSPQLVDQLRRRPIAAINIAARNFSRWLKVTVVEEQALATLQYADLEYQRGEVIDALIRAGASTPMMSALAGMSNVEMTKRRKALNVRGTAGHPPSRDSIDDGAIRHQWDLLTITVPDQAERYLSLHALTGVRVDQLYRIVTHADQAPAGSATEQ